MVVQLETLKSTLDSFTVEELEARYNIDRSSVFRRFHDLTVKGYYMKSVGKRGRYSIYSAEQVAIMDDFARHLDGKGLVRDFPAAGQQTLLLEANDAIADTTPDSRQYGTLASGSDVSRVVSDRAQVSDSKERAEPLASKGSFLAFLNQLLTTDVREVQRLFLSLKQSFLGDPAAKRGMVLAPQRELLEAARHEIELSTEQVAYLLGVQADTVPKYGDRFEDAGFIFFRVGGKRKNRQLAWGVVKKPKRLKQLLAALDQAEPQDEAE